MSRDVIRGDRLARFEPGTKRRRLVRTPYWMILPSLFVLTVIVYAPTLLTIFFSLTGLNQYSIGDWIAAPFVGIENYLAVLNPGSVLSAPFWNSVKTSIGFSALTTVIITPLGVGAALTLNERLFGRAILRSVALIPYAIPEFVTALLWRLMFLNGTGPIDQILAALHLGSKDMFWLIGPNAFWALVIADAWASWPFVYLMTLAALQSVPPELYDAAVVDGAGKIKRFLYITLPTIMPTLSLGLVLSTINHFNNFTLPFVMFGTAPPSAANVLPMNIYTSSFVGFQFGRAAAVSLIGLLIILVPASYYLRRVYVASSR